MSTEPASGAAPVPRPMVDRARPSTIAYRIVVLLLLCTCVWLLSRPAPPESGPKPAFGLPGSTWRRTYAFDKEQRTAVMEFREDGSITQAGSGRGRFGILSPEEVWIDPTSPTGGLFGWDGAADRWAVVAVADGILLQRKSAPEDRVVLHRVTKAEEQNEAVLRALQAVERELISQGAARRAQTEEILRALQRPREDGK